MAKKEIMLELNRVEGDLSVRLEIEDDVVTDAWTVGTMYRGFEQLMVDRAPMDSLVITPRVCGICGTAHLYSAVTALETAIGCDIAPNGTRIRNACLLSEEIQSDVRHAFLMFMVDLCQAHYREQEGYDAIVEAFEPFVGRIYKETVIQTKKILEIVALFGGQWPHSSYMIPGGVVSLSSRRNIVKALGIADAFIRWYERSILGCSFERWAKNETLEQLLAWVDEDPKHQKSAMGLFISFTRKLGLSKLGQGNGNMLSYGSCFDPLAWQPPFGAQKTLRASGFYNAKTQTVEDFSHERIAEHVKHSWYRDGGASHPYKSDTIPDYDTSNGRYTWAKAPRYDGHVVEVGCFPELFMAGDPLIRSIFEAEGANVWGRQFARLHRPTQSLVLLKRMLTELESEVEEPNYTAPDNRASGEGWGMVQAARGSLGHWVQFDSGKITRYQIVTPTTWNASPRDSNDVRGHWEQSLIGTPIENEANPVQLGHVIRSHDACLVCTVHFLETGRRIQYNV